MAEQDQGEAKKQKQGEMTIGYWSIRGLGAPCRMMTMYAGVKARFELYDLKPKEGGGWDGSAWFGSKKALKQRNPLMNLPCKKSFLVLEVPRLPPSRHC